MNPKKTVSLTNEQLELLVETLASAQIEADFASQKRHVLFLPDLFKTLTDHKKDLASLEKIFRIALNE